MKATLEDINSVQKRIRIVIPATSVDEAFDKGFRKYQKKAHLQGFRPGKAPMHMIKKLYGPNVATEVTEDLINTSLYKALDTQKINPISSPVVEVAQTPAHGKDYEYSAVIDIMPSVSIKDYAG